MAAVGVGTRNWISAVVTEPPSDLCLLLGLLGRLLLRFRLKDGVTFVTFRGHRVDQCSAGRADIAAENDASLPKTEISVEVEAQIPVKIEMQIPVVIEMKISIVVE